MSGKSMENRKCRLFVNLKIFNRNKVCHGTTFNHLIKKVVKCCVPGLYKEKL